MRNNKQQGMALIMSLVMVLIVALIGVAIAQQVISGRKNSAVYQDHATSFVRATSGINEAEFVVRREAYAPAARLNPNTANNLLADQFESDNWWQNDAKWVAANKLVNVTNAAGNNLQGQPRYIIEDAGVDAGLVMGLKVPKRRFVRITARAEGEGGAVSYLQSYVAFME
ncbi:pilus assembly PilX family protein [Agarivorans sp.]|uniref:pilus assembly PilX family protein n=1 Tax=Agarivorans sp. TaxID=1872412 RepID=UPI003CFDF0A6